MGDREAWLRHVREDPGQVGRVLRAMRPRDGASWPGRWWTKEALAAAVGGNGHAMSARMSDLRKMGYTSESKHVGNGLYLYRLTGYQTPTLDGNDMKDNASGTSESTGTTKTTTGSVTA